MEIQVHNIQEFNTASARVCQPYSDKRKIEAEVKEQGRSTLYSRKWHEEGDVEKITKAILWCVECYNWKQKNCKNNK